jgi:hypothetical protein
VQKVTQHADHQPLNEKRRGSKMAKITRALKTALSIRPKGRLYIWYLYHQI